MSKKEDEKKKTERIEVLMRILIAIVSGIVLEVWGYLICVIIVIHLFYTLFTGRRNKEFAEICEIWTTQIYVFIRYIAFMTNERPFPFNSLTKRMSKFK
ncbi:MAG: DUF4389 domain-containing protein [Candidatus Pacearchaeota archaeon]|jgi:hypothetical protein